MGKTLTVGKTTACFFQSVHHIGVKLSSGMGINIDSCNTQFTLRAMIWPTLMFVVSFIGTFISLIYVCSDMEMDYSEAHFCLTVTGVADTWV